MMGDRAARAAKAAIMKGGTNRRQGSRGSDFQKIMKGNKPGRTAKTLITQGRHGQEASEQKSQKKVTGPVAIWVRRCFFSHLADTQNLEA